MRGLIILALVAWPCCGLAYDNLITHPLLVRRGLSVSVTGEDRDYSELRDHTVDIRAGSIDEDIPELRGVFHFYDPVYARGLEVDVGAPYPVGKVTVRFPTALDTAFANPYLLFASLNSSLPIYADYLLLWASSELGGNRWDSAVAAYKSNDKAKAFSLLGNAAHLLAQDVSVPAHVHNDPHQGADWRLGTILGSADDPVYENYVQAVAVAELGQDIVTAFDMVGEGMAVKHPDELARAIALKAYQESTCMLVPGSAVKDPVTSEVVSFDLQVGARRYTASLKRAVEGAERTVLQAKHYEVNGVGDSPIYWRPDIKEDGGSKWDFDNDWWLIPNTQDRYYIERMDKVLVSASDEPDKTLQERCAECLIPLAIRATAQLYRMFATEVDPFPPVVTITALGSGLSGSDGVVIEEGGATDRSVIRIDAMDPTDEKHLGAAGIYKASLWRTGDSACSWSLTVGGDACISRTVTGLTCGNYELKVYDGLGNAAKRTFAVAPPLKAITIGTTPYVSGKRIFPITFEFEEYATGLVVVSPPSIIDLYGEPSASVFKGSIDLTNVCLNGQQICLQWQAGCISGETATVRGAARVPKTGEIAELESAQTSADAGEYPSCVPRNLSFTAPVMAIHVEPVKVTVTDSNGNQAKVGVANIDPWLEIASEHASNTRWLACLACSICEGKIDSPVTVQASVTVYWEDACKKTLDDFGVVGEGCGQDGAATKCLCAGAYLPNYARTSGTGYVGVQFIVGPGEGADSGELAQKIDFGTGTTKYYPVTDPSYPDSLPAVKCEPGGYLEGTIQLGVPTMVKVDVQNVAGVTVVSTAPVDDEAKVWKVKLFQDCSASGVGTLRIVVKTVCKEETYRIVLNAVSLKCTTIAGVYRTVNGAKVPVKPTETIPENTVVTVEGMTSKTGGQVKVTPPGAAPYVMNAVPAQMIGPCRGKYSFSVAVAKGQTKFQGLDSGTVCDTGKIVNADPSFWTYGGSEPASPASLPKAYLSPQASPGVQDAAEYDSGLGGDARVTARIFDSLGQEVAVLARDTLMSAGATFSWDGKNAAGEYVPDGEYRLLGEGGYVPGGSPIGFQCLFVVDNTTPEADFSRIEGMPLTDQKMTVVGTAIDDNLKGYKLECLTAAGTTVLSVEGGNPARNTPLGTMGPGLPQGETMARLTVTDLAGNSAIRYQRLAIGTREGLADLRVTVDDVSGAVVSGEGQYVPDNPEVYLDDSTTFPAGSTRLPEGGWQWASTPVLSGREAHTDSGGAGHSVHYFIHADKHLLTDGYNNDLIIQYVYLTGAVQEIMLQFYTGSGDGEHRAYWGGNFIQTSGTTGTATLKYMGNLPAGGQWVRLKIRARDLGLESVPIKGIAFHAYGADSTAKVYWDKTTTSSSSVDYVADQYVVVPNLTDDFTQWTVRFTPSRTDWLGLDIADSENRIVKHVYSATPTGGVQQVAIWDGADEEGNYPPNGFYYFQFRARDGVRVDCDRLEPVFAGSSTGLNQAWTDKAETSLPDGKGNTWTIESLNPENPRIVKRGPEGGLLSVFDRGSLVSPLDAFNPVDLTVGPNGSLFVLDKAGSRFLKLSVEGTYLGETKIGLPGPVAALLDADTPLTNCGNLFASDEQGPVVQVNTGRGVIFQSNLVADIVIPAREAVVRGKVPIIGTATARNFRQYKLTLSRSTDGAFMNDIITSTSEKVMSDRDLEFSPNGTVYGNLGTLNTGRDEYVYLPIGEYPDVFPSEEEGLNGVYTVTLKVETLDGRTAEDKSTFIVGRLISGPLGGVTEDPEGKTTLGFEAYAIEEDWSIIAVVKPEDLGKDMAKYPWKGKLKMGPVVEIKPACLKFNNPATMTMKYDPADLAANNLYPKSLGIYSWDAVNGQWNKLPSTLSASTNSVSTQLDSISCADALYGLFADPSPPEPPVIVQPATPTVLPAVQVTILGEPMAHVKLLSKHSGDAVYAAGGEADLDSSGVAKVAGVALELGVTELKAVVVDPSGNEGAESAVVSVERVPPAVQVESVSFRSPDFAFETATCCVDSGVTLGIELMGTADPAVQDTAVVSVGSSILDPAGIEVPLVETAPDSGVFHGAVTLGGISSAPAQLLAAGRDGEVVTVTALGATWATDSVEVRDETGPRAPVISSATHPSLMQATFENADISPIFPAGEGVTVFVDETTAATGRYCVRAVNTQAGGAFRIDLTATPYDLSDYPVLAFDYNIPAPGPGTPEVFLSLWIDIETEGRPLSYHMNFSEKKAIYLWDFGGSAYAQTIGDFPGVTADGTWHHVELSLKNLAGSRRVRKLFLANLKQDGFMRLGAAGENAAGAAILLDNVMVTGAGSNSLFPSFSWAPPADPSGIAGYSVVLDGALSTTPAEVPNATAPEASFTDDELRSIGASDLYLHVRAVDGAGNAGLANHYRIRVDAAGPLASNPFPAPSSQAVPSEMSLKLADPGGSGVDLDSVRLRVNEVVFSATGGGFTYDAGTGKLLFRMGQSATPPPVILNGAAVAVTLEAAPDKAGNPLQAPLSWTFYASYDNFARGQAVLLTVTGGRQPAWSADAKALVYAKDTPEGTKLFTIDPSDLQEKNGTARQVTFNPAGETANDSHPAWSPAAPLVAFERETGGQSDIYLMDAGTGALTRLTYTASSERHPAFSPDGNWVIYETNDELWRIQVRPAAGTPELLRRDVQRLMREPFWGYGSRILYRDALYVDNVRAYDPATGADTALTDKNTDSQPAWSPTGQQAVFVTRREGGASQLWVANADGTQPKKLLDNPGGFPDTEPAFAPDGSALAFESTRSGAPNIWLLLTLKVSPLLARPAAISPKNADGLFDQTVITYTVTGDALVTVTAQGPGGTISLAQDMNVNGGLNSVEWDGKSGGAFVASGVYSTAIRALSQYGGDPVTQGGQVRVDNEPPSTQAPAAGTFIKASDPLTFVSYDGQGAGVKTLLVREGLNQFKSYSFDPDTTGLYPGTIWKYVALAELIGSAPGEGSHSIQFRSVDGAENGEQVRATSVMVDAAPPRITVTSDTPPFASGGRLYARSTARYTVEAFDDGASVSGADSGIWGLGRDGMQTKNPFTTSFTGEGPKSMSLSASDRVGYTTSFVYSVVVDDTPPTSTAWAGPGAAGNGTDTYVRLVPGFAPTLTVTGVDGGSGVAGLETRLYREDGTRGDGGSGTIYIVTAGNTYSRVLATEGRWRVDYRGTDNVGNAGQERNWEVVVTSRPLPGVALVLAGPQYTDNAGRRYVAGQNAPSPTVVRIEGQDAAVLYFNYSLDGGQFVTVTRPAAGSAFAAELTLPAGRHTLEYYGVRSVADGGEEVHGNAVLYADSSAPGLSSLALSGSVYQGAGATYVTSSRTFADAVFADPAIAGTSDPGSGVGGMRYSFNGSAMTGTSGRISFAGLGSGALSLDVEAEDRVGNMGMAQRQYVLDDGAPSTVASYAAERYLRPSDNRLFLGNPGGDPAISVMVVLDAQDNAGGSGVARISWKLDGSAAGTDLVSGLPLAGPQSVTVTGEGAHILRYLSRDNLGTSEPLRVLPFAMDTAAPVTAVAGVAPSWTSPAGETYLGAYAGNQPAVTLNASDGAGAGVKATFYSAGGGAFLPYTPGQGIGLPGEGAKSLSCFSADQLGLYEDARELVIRVDLTPPVLGVEPQSATLSYSSGGVTFVAAGAGITISAADPQLAGGLAGSGVAQVSLKFGTQPPKSAGQATLTAPSPLSEGPVEVVAGAADRVANSASATRTFTVDALPPLTALTPVGAYLDTGVVRYADALTSYRLDSADVQAGGGAGSGTDSITYRVTSGGVTVVPDTTVSGSTATVSPLAPGSYAISWRARDKVGNAELWRSFGLTVVPAGEVPTVLLAVAGPQADSGGVKYVLAAGSPGASVISLKVRAGATTTHIRYALDSGPETTVPGPEAVLGALPAGAHVLFFRGVNQTGGGEVVEVATRADIVADGTAPVPALLVSDVKAPASVSGGDAVFVRPTASITVTVFDPAEGGAPGSGVASLMARLDGGLPFAPSSPVKLTNEGSHSIEATATDLIGLEALKVFPVRVDGSAPVTTIQPSGALMSGSKGYYASGLLSYAVLAQDFPAGAGAGVDAVWVSVDGAAATVFQASMPVRFSSDGTHTIRHWASDRLGNAGNALTFTVNVDMNGPSGLALTSYGPSYTDGSGRRYGSISTTYGATASDSGSGLGRVEVRLDSGVFALYSVPVGFAEEGAHVVAVKAFDLVGNASAIAEFPVAVDGTPPSSAIGVESGPSHEEVGVVRVGPATKLKLGAADPVISAEVPGSGVKEIRYQVAGLGEQEYAAPFALPAGEGVYTVSYYSRDNVLNREAAKVASFLVDATPPAAPSVAYDAATGDVVLTWTAGTEPDLAGYRVARVVNGDPATRTVLSGADLIQGTSLTDSEAAGLVFDTLTYEVVAVDVVDNASEPGTIALTPADLAPKLEVLAAGQPLEDGAFFNTASVVVTTRVRGATEPKSELWHEGILVASGTKADFTATVAEEGGYTVLLSAVREGAALAEERSFTLDRIPPVISVKGNGETIAEGALLKGPVVLEYGAADANPGTVAAALNGAPVASGIALTMSGEYHISVAAVDLAGNGALLDLSFTVDADAPAIPANLAGEALSPTSARLTWDRNTEPDLAGYEVFRDGTLITPELVPQPAEGPLACDDTAVPEGTGEAEYSVRAVDLAGNRSEPAKVKVQFDTYAPVTTLVLGQPSDESVEPAVVTSETPLGFTAVDEGPITTGVEKIDVFLDGAPSWTFTITGTVPGTVEGEALLSGTAADGEYTLSWEALDRSGNMETRKGRTVALDNTPPVAGIDLPVAGQAVAPVQAIEGYARDAHFREYRLEYAATGSAEFQGILPQNVFTEPVESGVLASWDTGSMADGSYILRLTVVDRVGHGAMAEVTVLKGCTPGGPALPDPVPVPGYVRSLGERGKGPGEMRLPVGVAVMPDGRVAVADTQNHRIGFFDAEGVLLKAIGGHGKAEGEFAQPEGLAAGPDGRLYVADRLNHRVQVFGADGAFLFSFGGHGGAPGLFNHPTAVALDADGRIYVVDDLNHRVQVFEPDGTFVRAFGKYGTGPGEFDRPSGIAVGEGCAVFVTDRGNNRVQCWSKDGAFLASLAPEGGLRHPTGISFARGDESHLYVSDTGRDRVVLLARDGRLLGELPRPGGPDRGLRQPHGLAWDAVRGLLYVADTHGNRVLVYGSGMTIAGSGLEVVEVVPKRFMADRGGVDIRFTLSVPSQVRVQVAGWSDGRVVWEPGSGTGEGMSLPAGEHTVHWEGRDNYGRQVPRGTYLAVVVARSGGASGRMAALVNEVTPAKASGAASRDAVGGSVATYVPGVVTGTSTDSSSDGTTSSGNDGVRDHGEGEGRDGAGQGKGNGNGPNK